MWLFGLEDPVAVDVGKEALLPQVRARPYPAHEYLLQKGFSTHDRLRLNRNIIGGEFNVGVFARQTSR